MQSIKLTFLFVVLFMGTTLMAQTPETTSKPVQKWIIEANTIKIERAIKDLGLSETDAAKYSELTLQSTITTIERVGTATNEDEKKAIRAEEGKKLTQKISATFPGKLGTDISTWNTQYWGKYLKK